MAGYDFDFYETGRISVTAGQKAFTGTGTAWKLRGCEGALVIVAGAGAVNFVSALTTDAAGEFRTAWTGPTLANVQYTMWLPSAVAATALANHQRLAEIIASIQAAQPESANLTALAGLNGDAETLVRFLANGAFDLIKSSDVGIQDPNGTLAAIVAAQGIPNSQLPARIREYAAVISDANEATVGGWNVLAGDGSNVPVPLTGFVFTIAQSTNLLTQIWYQRAGYRSFMRFCNNGTWGSWAEIASTASAAALALLQLTGAANALPYFTGAGSAATTTLSPFARTVIDDTSGAAMFATMGATQSLGGGSGYSKDPNGSLWQWGTAIVTPTASGFGSIPFPISFSNTNFITVPTNGDHNTQLYMLIVTNRASLNAGRFDFRAVNANSGAAITDPVRINYIAMGN
ncbi:pyocin knob domain-containing protein [Brucella pseudogrignonensis]|uniref:pyocin knob domain-containing protein n=1 Tax=Brucella pseudogrignonensis TaxID=419475 RepID=UPI0038D12A3D